MADERYSENGAWAAYDASDNDTTVVYTEDGADAAWQQAAGVAPTGVLYGPLVGPTGGPV